MSAFQVIATLQRVPSLERDELERMGDSLMEALLDLDVLDPAVSVAFSEPTIEIEMTVDAPSAPDALGTAQDSVHQALTAIGLSLVDPDDGEPDEWVIRRNRELAPA